MSNTLQYLLITLLMLVNKNPAVHCLFMLFHIAFTNVNNF